MPDDEADDDLSEHCSGIAGMTWQDEAERYALYTGELRTRDTLFGPALVGEA